MLRPTSKVMDAEPFLFGVEEKLKLLIEEGSCRERQNIGEKDMQMERVLVEPIRCWPHLFSSSLLIIYLWSMADQLCMERMRCGQPFLQCSHEAFHNALNTPRLETVHVYSGVK